MIQVVTEENIEQAARVHALSWRESHQAFCSKDFIEAHTIETQVAYIRKEMEAGKNFYLHVDGEEKGIVSIIHNLIENLYVLPNQQRKGYGTILLNYAEQKCEQCPFLWILSNNDRGRSFYQKHGYVFTGEKKELKGGLAELKMQMERQVKI